jgi:hypothetical protein
MSNVVHPHGPLRELAPGLWCVEGTYGRSPMGRRMSVVAAGRGLLLHSAMRLRDEELARLDALGELRWILVPNRMHASDAPFFAERHPEARVLVPALERERLAGASLRVDGTVEEDWPEELAGVLDAHPIEGLRIGETALHHRPSGTLVVNDLCMNFRETDLRGLLHRLLMKLNGVHERLGPSLLLKLAFVRDREALARSLALVLQLDLRRVVPSHGSVFEGDAGAALREAFAFLPSTPGRAGH